jgi:hypothetical protein
VTGTPLFLLITIERGPTPKGKISTAVIALTPRNDALSCTPISRRQEIWVNREGAPRQRH